MLEAKDSVPAPWGRDEVAEVDDEDEEGVAKWYHWHAKRWDDTNKVDASTVSRSWQLPPTAPAEERDARETADATGGCPVGGDAADAIVERRAAAAAAATEREGRLGT
jgi:hypothetical protein